MVLRQSIVVNCCQVELLEGKLDWELAGQDRKEEGERKTPPASRPVFDLIWYKKFLAWGPFPGGELTVPQAQKDRSVGMWASDYNTALLAHSMGFAVSSSTVSVSCPLEQVAGCNTTIALADNLWKLGEPGADRAARTRELLVVE